MAERPWTGKYLRGMDDVRTDWMRQLIREDPRDARRSLDFMNFAFYVQETADAAIWDTQDEKRRDRMRDEFRECMREGWGVGADDMYEALKHLKRNGNRWRDEDTAKYWHRSGKPQLYEGAHGFVCADACVTFVQAVEDRLGALEEIARGHLRYTKEIRKAAERDDWKSIGKAVDRVKSLAFDAEPYLWSPTRTERYLARVKTYSDWISRFHTGATRAVQLRTLGLSNAESIGLAAGATILDFVPILGNLYGAAVDWAIGFMPRWKQFMDDYHHRLDMASKGVIVR